MQIAILAGGMATRLRPVTETIPKSMVTVAGRPFLEWQLRLLNQSGVDEVVLCVGHLGHIIEDYFHDGSRWGVHIRYSREGEALLGTGGALKNAEPLLNDRFLVMYGDSYLLYDYAEIFRCGSPADVLMVVYRNEGRYDASNVALEGDRVARYEKGAGASGLDCIDAGLSVLTRTAVERLPAGVRSGLDQDLFAPLAAEGRLKAYLTTQRFYEIGSHAGLAELDVLLRREPSHGGATPSSDA